MVNSVFHPCNIYHFRFSPLLNFRFNLHPCKTFFFPENTAPSYDCAYSLTWYIVWHADCAYMLMWPAGCITIFIFLRVHITFVPIFLKKL